MSSIETGLQNVNTARLKTLVWPREHGAWGILLVPLVTGAAAGLTRGAGAGELALFTLAALALFCLRTPVESLLGASVIRAQKGTERQAVLLAAVTYGSLAAFALSALFWGGRNLGLFALGGAAALAFALQAGVRALWRRGRMAGQLIGAVGLTSTAGGAYYVACGRLDAVALAVWGANWLFAANQIHYVQLRIHGAKLARFGEKMAHGWGFVVSTFVTTGLLIGAYKLGLLPKLAVVAFHPVLLRGLAWFVKGEAPLRVHRLGMTELMHAVLFGAFFIVGFYWRH